MISVGKT
jgi:hypothetical protein